MNYLAMSLKCGFAVDKIYGLYGILSSCDLQLPAPDYKKRCEDVFAETTWAWIERQRDLNILQLASRCIIDEEEVLASWVPDWDQPSAYKESQDLPPFYHFSWFQDKTFSGE